MVKSQTYRLFSSYVTFCLVTYFLVWILVKSQTEIQRTHRWAKKLTCSSCDSSPRPTALMKSFLYGAAWDTTWIGCQDNNYSLLRYIDERRHLINVWLNALIIRADPKYEPRISPRCGSAPIISATIWDSKFELVSFSMFWHVTVGYSLD